MCLGGLHTETGIFSGKDKNHEIKASRGMI